MATTKKGNGKTKSAAKKAPRKAAPSNGARAASAVAFAEVSAFDDLGTDDFGGTTFSWDDRQLLGKVARFLTTVLARKLLRRAVGAGYSRAEHEELWTLYLAAAGRDQPLAFAFAAFDGEGADGRNGILSELDVFENEWFPKARAIIARRVPEDQVDRFSNAFFKDLQQQPLGPLVLDSVATFLDRVEALGASKEPGASEVLRNLRTRGLSDLKIAALRARIAEGRSGLPTARTKVDVKEWDSAQERQVDAIKRLRLAWNDWGTTLRPIYDVREQIQLGLTEVKVRADAPAAPPSPDLTLNAAQ